MCEGPGWGVQRAGSQMTPCLERWMNGKERGRERRKREEVRKEGRGEKKKEEKKEMGKEGEGEQGNEKRRNRIRHLCCSASLSVTDDAEC